MIATSTPELQRIRVEHEEHREKAMKQVKNRNEVCKKNLFGHKNRPKRSDENVAGVATGKEHAECREKAMKQVKNRKESCKKNLSGRKNRPKRSDENIAGVATRKEHVRSTENGYKKNSTVFSKQSVARSKPRPWPNFTNIDTAKQPRKPTWLLNPRHMQSKALQDSDAASSQVTEVSHFVYFAFE